MCLIDLDKIRIFNSFLKGISMSLLALIVAVGAHELVLPSGDIYWAVTAVTVGTFLSGFFSNYFPDRSLVESEDEITKEEEKFAAMVLASIAIILNFTSEAIFLPTLLTVGSVVFLVNSFREK